MGWTGEGEGRQSREGRDVGKQEKKVRFPTPTVSTKESIDLGWGCFLSLHSMLIPARWVVESEIMELLSLQIDSAFIAASLDILATCVLIPYRELNNAFKIPQTQAQKSTCGQATPDGNLQLHLQN